ncbi:MAG: hypothetical protein A2087_13410 [Spirochaetes bacterium GWD1_61_31]|nr:MAG: hypothetical protein A2Y37_02815 [Spirochaetes bacterium GWB1_60_80]OHD31302.1 MAG: hypothetical protein A2004_13690 [Spirochaetes bacterium GWC1_61_12]OHD39488.1 MAG: hypothetical protein A2087_13410 [Spirochaetes bacterium GWD1_61_31]OHD45540.1 MAG: hypothetical protein A2Y35_03085 [Spirochaetes bacterium GWE1_60_18]OHD58113.1 MAG: hypothetical protein A2Y32_05660 [Spirochaetes bacterium GWF1_60_12]
MLGQSIIHNGRLCRLEEASFNLDDIDITYGYGCYEVLRLSDGRLYFPEFHEERLLASARLLGFKHDLVAGQLVAALRSLITANGLENSTIKVMLIAHEDRPADWYAFQLPLVVPPADAHRAGVSCLLYHGERPFPTAKSLGMLLSTIAFREAKRLGCYDALLINHRGQLTEGTRTNLFWLDAGTPGLVFTPPSGDVLAGITWRTIITALSAAGVTVEERPLYLSELRQGKVSLLMTSTSSDIIPVRAVYGLAAPGTASELPLNPAIPDLQRIYGEWLVIQGLK